MLIDAPSKIIKSWIKHICIFKIQFSQFFVENFTMNLNDIFYITVPLKSQQQLIGMPHGFVSHIFTTKTNRTVEKHEHDVCTLLSLKACGEKQNQEAFSVETRV